MTEQCVGVFGAYGHTGRFVAAELKRRGIAARWIGRDHAALSALHAMLNYGDICVASVEDPASLATAFDGLGAVINCAGPFLDTSRPVIEAALSAGCHYLDVTAEQATVLDTISTFDGKAKAAGVVVMPAMAFFGGLADLIVTSTMAEWPRADEIEIAVALDKWHPTSGTRVTGERNTAPRLVIRNGQLVPVPAPPPTAMWHFPEPFGSQRVTCVALSEIVTLSRHLESDAITSYMTLKPLADLADKDTPAPVASDASGRSDQLFMISVRARRGAELRQTTVSGRDIYAITAPLVVEACVRLLHASRPEWSGIRSPGEIFDTCAFLAGLDGLMTREPNSNSNGRNRLKLAQNL